MRMIFMATKWLPNYGLAVSVWYLVCMLEFGFSRELWLAGFVVRVGQGFGGTIGYSDRPETQNNYLLTGWLNCVSRSGWFSQWQAVLLISEEIKMADTSWKESSSSRCFVCIITEIFCLIRWIREELRFIARILRKAVH